MYTQYDLFGIRGTLFGFDKVLVLRKHYHNDVKCHTERNILGRYCSLGAIKGQEHSICFLWVKRKATISLLQGNVFAVFWKAIHDHYRTTENNLEIPSPLISLVLCIASIIFIFKASSGICQLSLSGAVKYLRQCLRGLNF